MKDMIDTNVAKVKHYNSAGYVIREFNIADISFKKFYLRRDVDITGNSGTGIVCEGIQFSDGTCVIHWDRATNSLEVSSTVIYMSIDDVIKVHGHNGSTILVWGD